MAESHVLSALRAKYDELLGQLRECRKQNRRLHTDLAHIEGTIRLFTLDWDSGTAEAKRPRKPSRWAKPKEGGASIWPCCGRRRGPLPRSR